MNDNGLIYGLDIQTTSYLVSMSLFVSGIATFVNAWDWESSFILRYCLNSLRL